MMNKLRFNRYGGFLLCLALLMLLSVTLLTGTCFAKYSRTVVLKGTVKYTPVAQIIPANVSCSADESEYTVTNTGNVDEFIRVMVEPKQTDGAALPKIPVGEGWTQLTQDGVVYLYYNGSLAPGEKTGPAIDVSVLSEGFDDQVTIHAEAVSADDGGAEWGASYHGESWTADISN